VNLANWFSLEWKMPAVGSAVGSAVSYQLSAISYGERLLRTAAANGCGFAALPR